MRLEVCVVGLCAAGWPHTPVLVCSARFYNATTKLTHPLTRISIILSFKHSFRLDTSLQDSKTKLTLIKMNSVN